MKMTKDKTLHSYNVLVYLQVDFATNVFQLVTSFNSLSLTDTEVGLFAAIVLLTPDRPGVSDVKTVQHSQDRIVEAFKLQVNDYNIYYSYVSFKLREKHLGF